MINPIDKDKVTDSPGTLPYAHHVGSVVIRPEDKGKIKSKALTAMREQTNKQLAQIQKQVELMMEQAKEIKDRIEVSEQIYNADMGFEPLIHHEYHLYKKEEAYKVMLVGPGEWNFEKNGLHFVATVKLLADHTWEIVKN